MGGGSWNREYEALIKETLESYLKSYSVMPHHFIFSSSPKQFQHITKELIYIDMSELKEDNALSTMKKCSQKIGIGNIDKYEKYFSSKIADSFALNIEKEFKFHKNEMIPFDFCIKTFSYENTKHKKLMIFKNIESKSRRKISICIVGNNKKKAAKLLDSNKQIRDFVFLEINNFISHLENSFYIYEKNKIHENDVIEYFKKDRILYERYYELLQYEVSMVREKAIDIVESWDFFKSFLKINEELNV